MTFAVAIHFQRIIFCSVGTEELGHMEMIAAMVHQLTREMTMEEIKAAGFDKYFVDHTNGVYPVSAAGVPFTMSYLGVKGDPMPISVKIWLRSKRQVTYDNILRLVDDPDIFGSHSFPQRTRNRPLPTIW